MLGKLTRIAGFALAATLLAPTAAEARPHWRDHDGRWEHRGWDHRSNRNGGWHSRGWQNRAGYDRRSWERRRWEHRRWDRQRYTQNCRIIWRHHQRIRVCR
jgi:hypothetical protein